MLLRLLKRDMRLHWDALVVPLLILILVMGVIGIVNQGAAIAGLLLIGFLFIPILPMAIHVREASQGTMGDLVSLPVSRKDVVRLRYLEVLLFTAAALILAHLGTWAVLSAAAHAAVQFQFIDRSGLFVMGMLLLCFFAYPMPFALRWEGKGIAFAFATFFLLDLGLMGLSLRFPTTMEHYGQTFSKVEMHLMVHPGQWALVVLCLFATSYGLSLKAFLGKDF